MNSLSDFAVRVDLKYARPTCPQSIWSTQLRLCVIAAIGFATVIVSSVCSWSQEPTWPVEHTAGQFCIHSTVPAAQFEAYLPSLCSLPNELSQTLQVSVAQELIQVVVLENREALDAYAHRIFPSAPNRGALYIRHRGPGLVLTYFHDGWICDVRHECTHALLDMSGLTLPLWQDEGLAEYFETIGENPIGHTSHLHATRAQVRYGQVVDLQKMERMESGSGLNPKEYRDAWSIVTFLLHSSEETRSTYQQYLQDHQSKRAAGFLSHRLAPKIPSWREAFSDFYRR